MGKRQAKAPEPVLWSVAMRITLRTSITVEAATAEEARAKADSGDWEDDGYPYAERVDWQTQGAPKAES